jgi:hypothetical protein
MKFKMQLHYWFSKSFFVYFPSIWTPRARSHGPYNLCINLNLNIILILQTILRKLNRLLLILLIGIFQLKISFIGAKLNPYLQEPSMVRSKRVWRVWRSVSLVPLVLYFWRRGLNSVKVNDGHTDHRRKVMTDAHMTCGQTS